MDGSDEANNGDEQQEKAHSYYASDDVDAGDDPEALPPGCNTNQEQPHQLTGQSEMRKLCYCTETLLTLHSYKLLSSKDSEILIVTPRDMSAGLLAYEAYK